MELLTEIEGTRSGFNVIIDDHTVILAGFIVNSVNIWQPSYHHFPFFKQFMR